ncbi:Abi family protein [Lentilactobacillus parabuchneri]|uniref:Abi family protein n=1 Tax=Lentilactobacillus parabuchneri TaxID=152331 RepID=UPI001EFDEA0A|nr:Abi family protein [Lentilactobacillus parabuchneri]
MKKRNMIFLNEDADANILRDYGYYEIINGYKDKFMIDPQNDDKGFKPNTTFEHIYALYNLDKQLRDLTLQTLAQFEQIFKQHLAYVIARDISDDQNQYTLQLHYNVGKSYRHNATDRDGLIKNFNKTLRSTYQPYKYYRDVHGNIPPWIMIKSFTFGNSIYWFQLSKKSIQERVIARMFGIQSDLYPEMDQLFNLNQAFGDLLALYLDYRNLTAHGGRVYNHRSIRHGIRHYSPFIYREQILPISRRKFNRGLYRSSLGTLYKSLLVFKNKDPYVELQSWLTIRLENYLKQYPDDQQYLIDAMELDLTDIPKELKTQLSESSTKNES